MHAGVLMDRASAGVLLRVRGVIRQFGGVRALDGVDLAVAPGEQLCIIGPNGCGKTTLFNVITAQLPPTCGEVVFGGRSLSGLAPHQIARLGIARKFQVPSVFKELTVRENLEVAHSRHPGPARTIRLFPGSRPDRRIAEVVEIVELADELDTRAAHLSHGQTQWLEIAMLLVQDSALILMDEPTAGMTIQETGKTSRIFQRLRGRHTLIVVEHDMGFVREIAETITVLHQGRRLSEGSIHHVENDPKVREAYLGSGGISHA